jgi:phage terminase small subunit
MAELTIKEAEAEVRIAAAEVQAYATLNARRAAFVKNYLLDLNATQAAIRAGYSEKTAGSIAKDLMESPAIAQAIQRGLAARAERLDITQDKVLSEMNILASASVDSYEIDDRGNVQVAEGVDPAAIRAIKSIKKKIRHDKDGSITYDVSVELWDKPGSLKLMGRHVNLFADRVEHSGPNGGPIPLTGVRSVIIDPKADAE